MKTIFLANIWTELISIQFLELMQKQGYTILGNWLDGHWHVKEIPIDTRLVIYAPFVSNSSLEVNESIMLRIPTVFLAAFPDLLIGWDFEKCSYEMNFRSEVEIILNLVVDAFAVSNYVAKLMKSVYCREFKTLYWGLPIFDMQRLISGSRNGDSVTVLWNHMWRVDKGFAQALRIIDSLAHEFPEVQFIIGRREKWADETYSPPALRREYQEYLIRVPHNVTFTTSFKTGIDKAGQRAYWAFLRSADIGFSTALHEGFGLGMMEQAAAGVACVVPHREVYPELYPEVCLAGPSEEQIQVKIATLIVDREQRQICSRASALTSQKFTIEWMAEQFFEIFKKHI